MTLVDKLVNIFKEEVEAVFAKEAKEDSYLSQNIWGCRWRAFKGSIIIFKNAFPRFFKVLAYAIAKHRTEAHEEDKSSTMDSLSKSMSAPDVEAAQANFWN